MNHAEDRFVLVNSEFVGLYQAIAGHLTTVDKTLLLTDGALHMVKKVRASLEQAGIAVKPYCQPE